MPATRFVLAVTRQEAFDMRASAREHGVSVNPGVREAVEGRLARESMKAYVRTVEAEFGPLSEEEIAAAGARMYGDT